MSRLPTLGDREPSWCTSTCPMSSEKATAFCTYITIPRFIPWRSGLKGKASDPLSGSLVDGLLVSLNSAASTLTHSQPSTSMIHRYIELSTSAPFIQYHTVAIDSTLAEIAPLSSYCSEESHLTISFIDMAEHQSYALLTKRSSDGNITVQISESRLSEATLSDGTVRTDIFMLVSQQAGATFLSLMRPDSVPPSTPAFGEWTLYLKNARIDAETYRSMSKLEQSSTVPQTSGTERADRPDTPPPGSKTDMEAVTAWVNSLSNNDSSK
ncbi:hypothetical protein EHS25_005430 [Saitozyma podzolica]|uniref:Uncharacterized protein n=1 Tax=Saitozyma podzolica TaxID=1890683 RepID=A0A427XYM9_9TREE|nr:hypothetical protein EHS25_005430 [Saitozyma podzolica]